MKTAVIIHGYCDKEEYLNTETVSPSNNHWLSWLQKELLVRGILAQTPEMPGFYEPNYEAWKKMLERFDVNEETILVGHSCGGGFLVRYLSEENVRVGKVVLVVPWLDPEKEIDPNFFDFVISTNLVEKTRGVTILYSTDDMSSVLESVATLKEQLPGILFREYNDKGHFCLGDLGTSEAPEILSAVLGE